MGIPTGSASSKTKRASITPGKENGDLPEKSQRKLKTGFLVILVPKCVNNFLREGDAR